MARTASAKRFAEAAFQIASHQGQLVKWQEDLERMAEMLTHPQLVELLDNPETRLDEKLRLLEPLLAGMSPLARNLAGLLVSRGQVTLLPHLVSEYERLLDLHEGREHAQVTTALPLEAPQQERIKAGVAGLLKKEIVLSSRVDPAILGGVVIRVGDKLIDGSVRTRLHDLGRSLLGGGR